MRLVTRFVSDGRISANGDSAERLIVRLEM
jgi:hypothetical protein